MASKNEYPGYLKLPGKDLYHDTIRLDFNPHIAVSQERSVLEGFSLRMFTLGPESYTEKEQPEISVDLTVEQWLDLIDSMKEELDRATSARKQFEDGFDDPEE